MRCTGLRFVVTGGCVALHSSADPHCTALSCCCGVLVCFAVANTWYEGSQRGAVPVDCACLVFDNVVRADVASAGGRIQREPTI